MKKIGSVEIKLLKKLEEKYRNLDCDMAEDDPIFWGNYYKLEDEIYYKRREVEKEITKKLEKLVEENLSLEVVKDKNLLSAILENLFDWNHKIWKV